MSLPTGTYPGLSGEDFEALRTSGVDEIVDYLGLFKKVEADGVDFYLFTGDQDALDSLQFACEMNGVDFFYAMFDYIKSTQSVKPL